MCELYGAISSKRLRWCVGVCVCVGGVVCACAYALNKINALAFAKGNAQMCAALQSILIYFHSYIIENASNLFKSNKNIVSKSQLN